MNVLPFDKQVEIIAALTEGCSIRATERMTGVHRDTIMRLGRRVGEACARMHDQTMHSLRVNRIELDEAWSYVGKKQKRLTKADGPDKGDQYIFIALAGTAKAILSYRIGKRNAENFNAFLWDLRERVLGQPEISSDAHAAYPEAVERAFGASCTYGQIVKKYAGEPPRDAARRYSPGWVVGVDHHTIVGRPSHISTSYVERQNLSLRMASRRFTRLTNGFSKTLPNHAAAVSLYVAHYNLCRVHEALRVTPAMALGITDHIWTIGELVDVATAEQERPEIGKRRGGFTVIDGGRSE